MDAVENAAVKTPQNINYFETIIFNLSMTPLKKLLCSFFSGFIVWISGVIAVGFVDLIRPEYIDFISLITDSFIIVQAS